MGEIEHKCALRIGPVAHLDTGCSAYTGFPPIGANDEVGSDGAAIVERQQGALGFEFYLRQASDDAGQRRPLGRFLFQKGKEWGVGNIVSECL
ncbi:hypothetical protein D3C87_1996730 [compost metagenome]